MKTIFLLVFSFVPFIFLAQKQDSIIVKFNFIDELSKETIPNVQLLIQDEKQQSIHLTASHKGEASVKLVSNQTYKIAITHEMYQTVLLEKKINGTTAINYDIKLTPIKTKWLNQVTVKAPGVPDTVYKSEELSVADYTFIDGQILLLLYPKTLKKGTELALFDGMEVKKKFILPEYTYELKVDYRGVTHAIGEKNVFGIHLNEHEIGISKTDAKYFKQYIEPILDTNYSKLYFSNFNKDYPAFKYFSYDQIDSNYVQILEIQDDLMMELYRSEYKWADIRTKLWAKQQEYNTGIDAEIWVGAAIFTQSVYYKELYAPFYKKNDTLYIFDYYKDKMHLFNTEGKLIEEIAIFHHYDAKKTGWKKQLNQDPISKDVFALFEKNGTAFLGKINLKNGKINQKVQLRFKYVENVQVYNGFVYYIYRPFESAQKKYLYKEKLPEDLK